MTIILMILTFAGGGHSVEFTTPYKCQMAQEHAINKAGIVRVDCLQLPSKEPRS
jgi:hypothetical protein